MRKMPLAYALLLCVTLLFTACGEQDINAVVDRGGQTLQTGVSAAEEVGVGVTETVKNSYTQVRYNAIPELWYATCITAKRWAPVIMVGSFLIGFILFQLFRKNKEIQKFALTTLMIKVPAIVFVAVYVYAFLYGILN